jgi:hypothetical protein
VWGRRDGLV